MTKTKKEAVTKSPTLYHGVGRRKSSVARVWLSRGKGNVSVNGKDYTNYFDTELSRLTAYQPLSVVPGATDYDVKVNVQGGGLCSQADAIKLGIARALLSGHEALRPMLRKLGFLTVDDRLKERKKPGQKAARAKFQFVKR